MAATRTGAGVLIRDMRRSDLRPVKRIEGAAYQDAWPSRVFETELQNGFAHYRVAVQQPASQRRTGAASALRRILPGAGDRILGFFGVWYMVDQLHLVTIAVDPPEQGRGIGALMLLDCIRMAHEAELNEIVLEVRLSNERAQRLYQRFGFRRTGILKAYYRDNDEDALVMLSGPLDSPDARERHQGIRRALRQRYGRAAAG